MMTGKRSKRTSILLVLAVVLSGFASAIALPASAQETASPTISSDKADYSPGEHVTLTGANWAPGETVNIDVNDNDGQTWRHTVDVTAGEAGNISDEFDLPNWFVATYYVT